MLRSGYGLPLQYPDQHVVKVKRSLLKHKPAEFIKVSKTKQPQNVKNINYLDLSSQCSKVIDFGQRHEKKGRPGHKKVTRSKVKSSDKKKSGRANVAIDIVGPKSSITQKKREVHCQTESRVGGKQVVLETEVVQLPDIEATTTTVTVLDKEQWEKRKKSIRAKLVLRKEHLLTKDEEQDIHMRADVYAITTVPDSAYYVLPEHDCLPRPPMPMEEITINTSYPAVRKKRRRNYGSTNCYVQYHNEEDVYDNTRMLPIGSRLIKPPNKLVELVAQAVDGSPDGLLQVQQIYTYLQNRYPYFRYMERGAVNSWRSSIRHALYQKWFRKIRFDLNYISCKGCYWAINHKSSPREWTMPPHQFEQIGREEHVLLDSLEYFHTAYRNAGRYLQDQTYNENIEIISAAQVYEAEVMNNSCLSQSSSEEMDVENHIPSPVKEPDPILATCVPDWISDDHYYVSKTDSNVIDTLDPTRPSSTLLSPSLSSPVYSSPDEIATDLQLGTPITSPVQQNSGILSSLGQKSVKKCKNKAQIQSMDSENEDLLESTIVNETCDINSDSSSFSTDKESKSPWKNCGTLVLSPNNSQDTSKMYVFGYPLKLQAQDMMNEMSDEIDIVGFEGDIDTNNEIFSTFNNITGILQSTDNSSTDSFESSSDIVAEFTN